jgi:hypothetical protein
MKMKMTMLAGALALAVAGQASAQIVDTNNVNGSDLILSIWNTAGVSYTADLGVSMASFVDNTNFPGAIATAFPTSFTTPAAVSTSLAAFLSANAATASSFKWNVGAADQGNGIILTTTAAGNTAKVAATTDLALQAGINSVQLYYSGVNSLIGSATSMSGTSPTANNYAGNANFGSTWGANTTFSSTAAIGSAMDFYFMQAQGATSGLALTQQFSKAQFALGTNGLTYTVAAVPEPGEWLLMLSGLCLLGFVATRRKGQSSSMSFA